MTIIFYEAFSTVIDSLRIQFSQLLALRGATEDHRGYGYPDGRSARTPDTSLRLIW